MREKWISALGCVVGLAIVFRGLPLQAQLATELLLPDTTKGCFIVADAGELDAHFEKTQLGQLLEDPAMKPFVDQLRGEAEDRLVRVQKLGVKLEDLRGIATGELAAALIEPAPGQEAGVLLVNVEGNAAKAQAVIATATKNLVAQGAQQSQTNIGGTPVVVFDMPPRERDPRSLRVLYFLNERWLGISDNLETISAILGRLGGQKTAALASVPAYQAIVARCQKDSAGASPQVRWFIEPFGYARAIRAALPEDERPQSRTMAEILESQGFNGIQGIGGFVDFTVNDFEMLHRTFVFAPPPRQRGMAMISLPNSAEVAPQPWVPRELTTYITGYVEALTAFDNFGPLFDEMFGEGEVGVWADVLEGLEQDPHGPQISLRDELMQKLGTRFTVIRSYVEPVSITSERMIFALEAKDEKAVAIALDKMFRDDKQMRQRTLGQYVIWETIPGEKPVVPSIPIEAIPPLVSDEGFSLGAGEEEEEEQAPQLFPNSAVAAANGQLLVASHLDALVQLLEKQPQERETLAKSVDFLRVADISNQLGIGERFLQSFIRTDEQYRVSYELFRQGKMPEAETMFARILNTLFGADRRGEIRQQEIDASTLPDYEVVRRYLGPAGLVGTSETDGWFFKGFTLNKQAQ